MASIKELNALLLRHGLFPEKQALVLLRHHVEGAADVKAEVAAVIHRVKASADMVKNRVTKDIMEHTLAVEGDAENECKESIVFLDHKSVPVSIYDPVRKVMTRKAGPDRWLEDSSKPRTRIQAFRERFELIEQRVLNNRIFAKKSFYVDDDASARPELTRVSGVRRAEGTVCILGLLTQPQEGQFFLEDLSGRVEVDITAAEASVGLYTENCIIIVEGVMKGEVLVANCLAMPPSEDREKTCARFPALAAPDDRKPYTQEEWERLRREEEQQVDANVVVLSDVWLDRPRVISGLKKLFGRYDIECQKRAEEGSDISLFFVLMGNFLSHSSAHGVAAHREGFDKLATLLESFQSLLQKAFFVIVPGPNDNIAGNALMLPRNPLPDIIVNGFQEKIPQSTFQSNPCRIKFYSQELVFHRDDVCSKMRQYSRKPTEGKCLHDHAVKTLLSQGHLVPLPLHAVLADRASAYDRTLQSTKINNPGSFANDFSFSVYTPVDRATQAFVIDEVDEIPDSERARRAEEMAMAKKKKLKKRKEMKAAREAAAYEGGESFKGDSKTPKTRKKAVLTRDGAVDEKGAITTFFSRRPAEMEEDGDGFVQGRRRLRQRGDSDDDESDEDSEAGESGEESGDSNGDEEQEFMKQGSVEGDSDEELEAQGKRLRQSAAMRQAKRGRLADSDDEEPRVDGVKDAAKTALVPAKSASDDADSFAYVPPARMTAHVSS